MFSYFRIACRKNCGSLRSRGSLAFFFAVFLGISFTPSSAAQTQDDTQTTIRLLSEKVQQLEKRLEEVEGKQNQAEKPAATVPDPPQAAPVADPPHEHTMEIPGGPVMRIRGFTDVNYLASNQKGATNTFALGAFDLFISSQISEHFSMLSELNFEFGDDNELGVDLERMMLTYSLNDHFNLSFGRYHTGIGYYNTAFHHGTWFQTATGRPFLFFFEDDGGVLPVHNVGMSLTGTLPSGKLGLHYVAEIGNGRPARVPQNSTVQNLIDENNGKSFNLGLWARPEWVRGMQVGASLYHDHLMPGIGPRIEEFIPAVHAVWVTPEFEWLNEGVVIRHSLDQGGRTFNTSGFYTQVSRQWKKYRPYFRYQYFNASPSEPLLADAGLQHGPSLGLRYDWSPFAAFKIQYDHSFRRDLQDLDLLGLQMSFTF
jgi:hypothetical protein